MANYRKLNEDYAELEAIKNRIARYNFDTLENTLTDLFCKYLPAEENEKAEQRVKKVTDQIDEIQKRIKETIEAKFK